MSSPPFSIRRGIAEPQDLWPGLSPARLTVLAGLFFLISFGLGYATLNRFDPRRVNHPDSVYYHDLVTGDEALPADVRSYRILVPLLARPIHFLAKGHVGSWNPVFFSLLVVNAALVSAACLALLSLGLRVTSDLARSLLGVLLYLLNFAIVNHQLTGLVDAAESFGLLVLALVLRAPRFWAFLLLGFLGTSAKESFLPLSLAFVAGWHCPWNGLGDQARKWFPRSLAALFVGGILSLAATRLFVDGNVDSLAQILQSRGPSMLLIVAPVRAVTSPGFWYVYAWLLPLGILGLRALPRDWIRAVFAASALAFSLILLRNPENAARVTFTVCGPLLSLAAALWLAGPPTPLPDDQTG